MSFDLSVSNLHTESIGTSYYLIGLINRFNNSFQAAADSIFPELSWKQIFFMNCVALFKDVPTIKDMAELLTTISVFTRLNKNVDQLKGQVEG